MYPNKNPLLNYSVRITFVGDDVKTFNDIVSFASFPDTLTFYDTMNDILTFKRKEVLKVELMIQNVNGFIDAYGL